MRLCAQGAWGWRVRLVGAQIFTPMDCRGALHVTAARYGWVRPGKLQDYVKRGQWDSMQVVSALGAALQR